MSRRCSAERKDGGQCLAFAVRGTDPPRCGAHAGSGKHPGAPKGNQNALKHGFYVRSDLPEECTIEALIENLYQRHVRLDSYINGVMEAGNPSIKEVVGLLRLHGRNTSRLARLLRDQRALSGDAADGISGAIAQALDELSTELGVKL